MDDIDLKDRNETDAVRAELVTDLLARGPDKEWLIQVDVYLEDAASDPAKFRLESCLPMDLQGVITFHNRGRPGFEILFNLIDETNSGYCFPPNRKRDDALWSRQGPGCPPKDYGQQWDQFEVVRVVEPDRTTLVVHNKNDFVTEFGYTLRVTNDGGVTFVDLDPGGLNQDSRFQ